ncbi:prevent-host-death protein [Burkholderia aenigmatica]|uniref:Prevent-host-death protein n=1 Tax=Burkholderia aenigmatica TaxID=2015348 RepID=A0ABY6XJ97_9BURK|nr:prevent-host-death protein [Burkholderia aenigmatica]VWD15315.1 prevent-host-death protein [Burkholderia aenigmatica]
MRSHRNAIQLLDVLRGSVLRYDDPVDPIKESGWEAPQRDTRNEGVHADTYIDTPG